MKKLNNVAKGPEQKMGSSGTCKLHASQGTDLEVCATWPGVVLCTRRMTLSHCRAAESM